MNSQAASEAFYAALLDDDPEQLYERAPCGYLTTTPNGVVVKVNQTFLTLTGYERDDLVGKLSFSELLTTGGRIYHETHFAPSLRMQGTVREMAFDVVRADGVRLPVLVNAVLEHIPQPRGAHIREIWRVLRPGGHLLVNETPNKYLPKDVHTTGLWWVPWLPKEAARRYAVRRGRFRADGDWESSGWRGLGYYELVRALGTPYRLLPERSRPRHRLLARLGLPASLFDPYPTWVLRKG